MATNKQKIAQDSSPLGKQKTTIYKQLTNLDTWHDTGCGNVMHFRCFSPHTNDTREAIEAITKTLEKIEVL